MDRAVSMAADQADPLAGLRAHFDLPPGIVYLDGNSLGPLQVGVSRRIREVVESEWGHGLIRSWNDAGWVELPARVATRLAPLIGARPDEVAVTSSTSTNLFKILDVARQLRPDRRIVLTDDANFPTDVYVASGLAELTGDLDVEVVPSDAVVDHLDAQVAAVMLTHVDYRTGRLHDAPTITTAAHAAGALAIWDLSHSAGAVEVDLTAWDADLAVGCTYKYLNGGPGSPAYLYVARRWHEAATTPIRGWFGHARPFTFGLDYVPADGAHRFLDGTPSVLSTAALEAALEVWDGVDVTVVAAKARALTDHFIALVDARCGGHVEVVSPRDALERGAQVALRHPEADALVQALIARGVIGDHRPPDLLRFGFAPLYVSHRDVWDAVDHLADLLETGDWDRPRFRASRTVI